MLSDFMNGLLCLCGAFLIHFSLGTLYTFGNMSPYMASYLRLRTTNNWVTPGHMVWIFAFTIFSQGITMALGGVIEKKIGIRLTCLIGCWTMSFSVLLTYFSIQQNIWSVMFSYGVFYGIGTGLSYSVAIAAPIKWFPLRKGLIAGIVVAGYGLGSLLFNIVQTSIINPLNISPNFTINANMKLSKEKYFSDEAVLDMVPICFLIIGSAYIIIQFTGVILLMNIDSKYISPEEKSLLNSKVDEDESNKESIHSEIKDKEDFIQDHFTVKDAIKTKKFWILWGTFFFNGISVITASTLYKTFGQQFINNDRYFAIVGAVSSLFNASGRIFWGRLFDISSYRIMMSSMTISLAIAMSTFYLCSIIPSNFGPHYIYFIWVCFLFFCISGTFALLPAATAQSFGNENMAIIYGLIFIGYGFSSILGAIISSMLLKFIHYGGVFTIASVAALISLCMTQFFEPC